MTSLLFCYWLSSVCAIFGTAIVIKVIGYTHILFMVSAAAIMSLTFEGIAFVFVNTIRDTGAMIAVSGIVGK